MLWDLSTIADHLAELISRTESAIRLEQAVYGLDSKDEKAIQSILADGLAQWHEVAREVHYPSTHGTKLAARQRCDLVLSPKGRPLVIDSRPLSLFDPPNPCPPQEGLWLEVKIAYQFRKPEVRHGGYGAQWREAVVNDLKKMEIEPKIREAALVLVVFNESESILQKDLELFELVLIQKEVLAGFRHVRSVPIVERMGHRLCSVVVWPTVQR